MPHAICVGVSGCGKTTLMKQLAKKLPRVAVCEYGGEKKVGKTDWGKTEFHTLDIEKMLWFAQHNISCNIFIDDAGDNMQRSKDFDFFTTCGRRWGHTVFLITQRATQLSPNIRSNCETIYCFRQSQYDVDKLLEDFPPDFSKAVELKKFEFLAQKTRFDSVTRHIVKV
jgi:ABC-type glutathione transport system ATPase component